jgi:hypothetical protein
MTIDNELRGLAAILKLFGALGLALVLPSWALSIHALFFWLILLCEVAGVFVAARQLLRIRICMHKPKLRIAVASALAICGTVGINIALNIAWYAAHDGT